MKTGYANRVRIIGGQWRGRVLRFPDVPGLRPTPDRVRETLFNWLGQDLTGQRCLDLFAGSGALGFEAASRGAQRVVLVERSRVAAAALHRSAAELHANSCEVLHRNALEFLAAPTERFDVVFLDPPFDDGILAEALDCVHAVSGPASRVYVEAPDLASVRRPGWRIVKEARAGVVHFALLERATE